MKNLNVRLENRQDITKRILALPRGLSHVDIVEAGLTLLEACKYLNGDYVASDIVNCGVDVIKEEISKSESNNSE